MNSSQGDMRGVIVLARMCSVVVVDTVLYSTVIKGKNARLL
jgi:hypothetical protein